MVLNFWNDYLTLIYWHWVRQTSEGIFSAQPRALIREGGTLTNPQTPELQASNRASLHLIFLPSKISSDKSSVH